MSRKRTSCDKWVLSGGCGVGKLTLFPSDYISRQENGTRGEWLEFHRTKGQTFVFTCLLNDKETRRRHAGGVQGLGTYEISVLFAMIEVFLSDDA